jgi:hypothetical protein
MDPDWIRILIRTLSDTGIHPKMLDPGPDSINQIRIDRIVFIIICTYFPTSVSNLQWVLVRIRFQHLRQPES